MTVLKAAGGHFVGWAAVLPVRDPTDTVLAVTWRHRRLSRNLLAQRNRLHVAQFSYSDDVEWFQPSFSRNSQFTGFWRGLGTYRIPGPTRQKKKDPEKPKKFHFLLRFHTRYFGRKRCDFSSFLAVGAPIGAVCTEKTQPFSGQKIPDPNKSKKGLKNFRCGF